MKLLHYLALIGSTVAIRERSKPKSIIEIDLTQTAYKNENDEFVAAQLDSNAMMQIESVMPKEHGKIKSLVQTKKDVVESDMINLMNMGYEGEFWFGKPSQKMQIIFDTGSAWAWLFSEKCKGNNCPV
jgi:hypothetical protein